MNSEQINEIAQALSKAQAAMPPAKMNATNPFLKNRYADLGSVIEAARKPLADNGLSIAQLVSGNLLDLGGQYLFQNHALVVLTRAASFSRAKPSSKFRTERQAPVLIGFGMTEKLIDGNSAVFREAWTVVFRFG